MALLDEIEQQTQAIGREIFARIQTESPSVFHFSWWDEKILEWCMRDEALKVQMFRFIDVLPMLKTGEQVAQHLQEYFLDHQDLFPVAVQWGLNVASLGAAPARAVALAEEETKQQQWQSSNSRCPTPRGRWTGFKAR